MIDYQFTVVKGGENRGQPGMLDQILTSLEAELPSMDSVIKCIEGEGPNYIPYNSGFLFLHLVEGRKIVDWIYQGDVPLKFEVKPVTPQPPQKP
jgi:hypothetical protein